MSDVIVTPVKSDPVIPIKPTPVDAGQVFADADALTPIEVTKVTSTPNAAYVSQLMVQTSIVDGVPVQSLYLYLTDAYVDEEGKYTSGYRTAVVTVPNLSQLEEDLAGLQADMNETIGRLVKIVKVINAVRKVI